MAAQAPRQMRPRVSPDSVSRDTLPSKTNDTHVSDSIAGTVRAVLRPLVRLGVARLNERDEVVLNTAALIPQAGFDEKLYYQSLNVGDHAMAAVDNTLGRGDPWFERCVHYCSMAPQAIDRLRARAAEPGMQSLQALNTEAQGGAGAESDDSLKMRFTFGVYFHAEGNDEKKES